MIRRAYLALVLALAVILGTVPSNAGPGSSHWTQWSNRRPWTPLEFGSSLVVWINASRSAITLGGTPRAYGTTPPAVTYTGTLTGGVTPYLQIDLLGARGTATFKVSYDDGSTFPHTGILTAATVTLPGIGSAITANFPVGTYATNNIYKACVDTASDLSGSSNAGTKTDVTKQVLYRTAAFNGRPAFDWETGGAGKGLDTPSISLGAFSIFVVEQMTATNVYVAIHSSDSAHQFYDGTSQTSKIVRSSVTSQKSLTAGWISTGSPLLSILQTYGGAHATHLLYKNGVDQNASSVVANDPGTSAQAGVLHIGHWQTESSAAVVFQGLQREIIVLNRAVTAAEAARLHQWAKQDSGL